MASGGSGHRSVFNPVVLRSGLLLLVASEFFIRIFPEVIGLGDSVLIPVVTLLGVRYILSVPMLGWLLGWILYASIVFQLAPLLLPRSHHVWAHSLANRLTMAFSSALVGMYVERYMTEQISNQSTPLPLGDDLLPFLLLAIVLMVFIALRSPPLGASISYFSSFSKEAIPVDSPPGYSTTGPYVLTVGFIAILLANISLLFPLPELLILGVIFLDVGEHIVGRTGEIPAQREYAERIVQGVSAVWAGPSGLVWVLYFITALYFTLLFDGAYFRILHPLRLFRTRPTEGLFVIYCLTATTVLITVSITRLAERVPAQISLSRESDVTTTDSRTPIVETVSKATPPGDDRQRVPGFLVPATLPMLALELSRPGRLTDPGTQIPAVHISPELVAVALGGGFVGVLAVWRPQLFPSSGLGDYAATFLSFACFFFLMFVVSDIPAPTGGSLPVSRLAGRGSEVVLALSVALSPVLGYETFSSLEEYNLFEELYTIPRLVGLCIVAFLAGMIGGVVIMFLPHSSLQIIPTVGLITLTVGMSLFFVCVGGILVRVLCLFYL